MEPSLRDHYDYVESRCPGLCKDIHDFLAGVWTRIHAQPEPEPQPEPESMVTPWDSKTCSMVQMLPDITINNIKLLEISLAKIYLDFLNEADIDDLSILKGVGTKRFNAIVALREIQPRPFQTLSDMEKIRGMSPRVIQNLLKEWVTSLFFNTDPLLNDRPTDTPWESQTCDMLKFIPDITKNNIRSLEISLAEFFIDQFNKAPEETLLKLKGVGIKRARAVLSLREQRSNPFERLDDFRNTSGMPPIWIQKLLKDGVTELFFN